MCGFTFVYDNRKNTEELVRTSQHALKKLYHRGPDDQGIATGDHWVAGHRRLAIIDLTLNTQPLSDPSGRYQLVYNGELYNFRELKSSLSGKWQFLTNGDTEVILAGLICWGENFINRLDGMWAFAFWDCQEQTLLLSRDRIGKKPLYYETSTGYFACASEIPALCELRRQRWSEEPQHIADYFRYGFCLPGKTIFSSVHEVLPGQYLKWKPTGTITCKSYWKLSIDTIKRSQQETYDLLRQKLFNAVKKRLVADVEIGAFLSGGIDSSLILSILSTDLGLTVKTFTLGFADSSYDESKYAEEVSSLFSSIHFSETFQSWNHETLIKIILENVGQPFGDASILPTAMISQLASKHVKVVLSGDGGDELFGGYQRYLGLIFLKWYIKLPHHLKAIAEKFIYSFPSVSKHHSRSLLKKAQLFAEYTQLYGNRRYLAPVILPEKTLEDLFPHIQNYTGESIDNFSFASEDEVLNAMYNDVNNYLPQDILAKVDRASMLHSLETRCPFLDKELIELAFSIPRSWHRDFLKGKKALRGAFKDHLPSHVWSRNKQGFSVPLSSWFKGNLGEELIQLTKQHNNVVNFALIVKMIDYHRKDIRDYSFQLWLLYIYFKWKEFSNVSQLC